MKKNKGEGAKSESEAVVKKTYRGKEKKTPTSDNHAMDQEGPLQGGG